MAAITAIRSRSSPTETHLFYCSSDRNVEYQSFEDDQTDQISLERADNDPIIPGTGAHGNAIGGNAGTEAAAARHEEAAKGPMAHPGSLVSFYFHEQHEFPVVYGIRSNGHISMFVPGIRPLQRRPKTQGSALAGCSDGNENAWLYFITNANVDPPIITQYSMTGTVVAPLSNIDQQVALPNPGTALTAYYLPTNKTRACIYQGSGSNALRYIQYVAHQQGPPTTNQITGTDGALLLTPLATVVVGNTVVLYFISLSHHLQRTHMTLQGWTSQVVQVGDDTTWGPGPITATVSGDGKGVTIRQVSEGDDSSLVLVLDDVRGIVSVPL